VYLETDRPTELNPGIYQTILCSVFKILTKYFEAMKNDFAFKTEAVAFQKISIKTAP
jgi:hypothetical protein